MFGGYTDEAYDECCYKKAVNNIYADETSEGENALHVIIVRAIVARAQKSKQQIVLNFYEERAI